MALPLAAILGGTSAAMGLLKWIDDRAKEREGKQQLASYTALMPYMAKAGFSAPVPGQTNSDFMGTVGGAGLAGVELAQKNPDIMKALAGLGMAKNSIKDLDSFKKGPLGANTNLPRPSLDINDYIPQ
jgi:hypothetical protein